MIFIKGTHAMISVHKEYNTQTWGRPGFDAGDET
jgi:hypothetical protein